MLFGFLGFLFSTVVAALAMERLAGVDLKGMVSPLVIQAGTQIAKQGIAGMHKNALWHDTPREVVSRGAVAAAYRTFDDAKTLALRIHADRNFLAFQQAQAAFERATLAYVRSSRVLEEDALNDLLRGTRAMTAVDRLVLLLMAADLQGCSSSNRVRTAAFADEGGLDADVDAAVESAMGSRMSPRASMSVDEDPTALLGGGRRSRSSHSGRQGRSWPLTSRVRGRLRR